MTAVPANPTMLGSGHPMPTVPPSRTRLITLFRLSRKGVLADPPCRATHVPLPTHLDGVSYADPLHPQPASAARVQSIASSGRSRRWTLACRVSPHNLVRIVDTEPQTTHPLRTVTQSSSSICPSHAAEVIGSGSSSSTSVYHRNHVQRMCQNPPRSRGRTCDSSCLARSVEAGMVPNAWLPPSGPEPDHTYYECNACRSMNIAAANAGHVPRD